MAFRRKHVLSASLAVALLFVLAGCVGTAAQYPQTTFEPVSEFGRFINGLFYNTTLWTIGIMFLVEILILVIIFKFRENPDRGTPKQIHGHTWLEVGWTIVPSIIVLAILVPTVRGIFKTQATPPKDALVVEVIGHQWWWEFRYPELGVVTANELVLPTDRNIDLQLHSADVIHSYWVPRVGGKKDVNPQPRTVAAERARINHIQFNIEKAGYYSGQCAEYCGDSHGLMRTAILAMTPDEFRTWSQSMGGGMPVTQMGSNAPMGMGTAEKVPTTGAAGEKEGGSLGAPADTLKGAAFTQQQPKEVAVAQAPARPPVSGMAPTGAPAPGRGTYQDVGPVPPGTFQQAAMVGGESLEEQGKKLFTSRACVACHTINGTTAQGKIGPNLTRFGMRRGVGAFAAPATLENVVKWIHRPRDIKPGALMPGANEGAGGMPATGLTDPEVRAIATYLKSLK